MHTFTEINGIQQTNNRANESVSHSNGLDTEKVFHNKQQ